MMKKELLNGKFFFENNASLTSVKDLNQTDCPNEL